MQSAQICPVFGVDRGLSFQKATKTRAFCAEHMRCAYKDSARKPQQPPPGGADELPALKALNAVEIYNHNAATAASPDRAHGAYMLDSLLEKGKRVLVYAETTRTSAAHKTASGAGWRSTATSWARRPC